MQFVLLFLVVVYFSAQHNVRSAYSAWLGGLVYIIPNALFAFKLVQFEQAGSAKQIVRAFYSAEALKIVVSMLLFATVFIYCKLKPVAFFGAYVMLLMTHWFAPWIIVNKQKRPKK